MLLFHRGKAIGTEKELLRIYPDVKESGLRASRDPHLGKFTLATFAAKRLQKHPSDLQPKKRWALLFLVGGVGGGGTIPRFMSWFRDVNHKSQYLIAWAPSPVASFKENNPFPNSDPGRRTQSGGHFEIHRTNKPEGSCFRETQLIGIKGVGAGIFQCLYHFPVAVKHLGLRDMPCKHRHWDAGEMRSAEKQREVCFPFISRRLLGSQHLVLIQLLEIYTK